MLYFSRRITYSVPVKCTPQVDALFLKMYHIFRACEVYPAGDMHMVPINSTSALGSTETRRSTPCFPRRNEITIYL